MSYIVSTSILGIQTFLTRFDPSGRHSDDHTRPSSGQSLERNSLERTCVTVYDSPFQYIRDSRHTRLASALLSACVLATPARASTCGER